MLGSMASRAPAAVAFRLAAGAATAPQPLSLTIPFATATAGLKAFVTELWVAAEGTGVPLSRVLMSSPAALNVTAAGGGAPALLTFDVGLHWPALVPGLSYAAVVYCDSSVTWLHADAAVTNGGLGSLVSILGAATAAAGVWPAALNTSAVPALLLTAAHRSVTAVAVDTMAQGTHASEAASIPLQTVAATSFVSAAIALDAPLLVTNVTLMLHADTVGPHTVYVKWSPRTADGHLGSELYSPIQAVFENGGFCGAVLHIEAARVGKPFPFTLHCGSKAATQSATAQGVWAGFVLPPAVYYLRVFSPSGTAVSLHLASPDLPTPAGGAIANRGVASVLGLVTATGSSYTTMVQTGAMPAVMIEGTLAGGGLGAAPLALLTDNTALWTRTAAPTAWTTNTLAPPPRPAPRSARRPASRQRPACHRRHPPRPPLASALRPA
jgi:hypothetical protein